MQQREQGKDDAEKQTPETTFGDNGDDLIRRLPDRLIDAYGGRQRSFLGHKKKRFDGRVMMANSEGMSQAMADFINRLSPEEKESFLEVLRDSRTYLAEDMTDVIAILKDLKD